MFSQTNHILIKSKQVLTLVLVLILVESNIYALNGQIKGFQLSMCSAESCMRLVSDQAYMGQYSKNYAFDQVKFEIENRQNKIKKSFIANDVYYDSDVNKILFRDIVGMSFKQAVYDIDKGLLTEIKNVL